MNCVPVERVCCAKKNSSIIEHKKEMLCDSDEHVSHMSENSFEEDGFNSKLDTTMQQNMLCFNENTVEKLKGTILFYVR